MKTSMKLLSWPVLIIFPFLMVAQNPASFTGLQVEQCLNDSAILLVASNDTTGTYSGPGIIDNLNGTAFFNPSLAGIGNHTINYTVQKRYIHVSSRASHTAAIRDDSTLWVWGANNFGQFGIGTTSSGSLTPILASSESWKQVEVGSGFTIALKADGTLWACGFNSSGNLGLGNFSSGYTTFTQVGTSNDWAYISCGTSFTLAIKQDGTLWAWGANNHGQLGDGTTSNKNTPTQIGLDADWNLISAGSNHALALKSNNTLFSWGRNNNSQLGDGTTTDKTSPIQIGNDTWIRIAAGGLHSLAISTDSSLWSWGNNTYGQLGDGTLVAKITPFQVGTGSYWLEIAAGDFHSLAIKNTTQLFAMGRNNFGQLGDGTTINRTSPTQITQFSGWEKVFGADASSFGIHNNNALRAWGANENGILGDGTTITKFIPTNIQFWSITQLTNVLPIPEVDVFSDYSVCGYLILPELNVGDYYSMQNGMGQILFSGDTIFQNATLYIYELLGSCHNESSFTIDVSPLPFTNLSLSLIDLFALQDDATYQWLNCSDYSFIENATNQGFAPEENGDYAVIIDLNGCVDTSECFNIFALEIVDFAHDIFVISPNPAFEKIQFIGNIDGFCDLLFYDASGKLVKAFYANDFLEPIDVWNLESGLYLIKLIQNEKVLHGSLIKL